MTTTGRGGKYGTRQTMKVGQYRGWLGDTDLHVTLESLSNFILMY